MASKSLPDQRSIAHEWADDDGRPLGAWVEIDRADWNGVITQAGGIDALSVFSTLTDPDGFYGPAQVYTAWGLCRSDVPLVDARDYKGANGRTERQVLRKFVSVAHDEERADG